MSRPTPSIHHLQVSAEARLRLALRSVDAALAEQRQAIEGLRTAFAALGASVHGLSESVTTYRGALDATAREVARSRDQAGRLAATAAAMERAAKP